MADGRAVTTVSDADYDAIEAAVMETARGRWFLAEFANRHRVADTAAILMAIQRIEAATAPSLPAAFNERLREILAVLARARSRWCATTGGTRDVELR